MGWWLAVSGSSLARAAEDSASAAGAGLNRFFNARASAIAIGRVFLAEHPEEASTLRAALGLPPGDLGQLSDQQIGFERQRLLAVHHEDFAKRRVQELGGYLFSLTELRLAALLVG